MTSHEVSVVISTYKGADTLSYVLTGLKRQTFEDFEVVAVVKPSGDETLELLRKNGTKLDIKVVIQKNGNVVDAEQVGLETAEGRIIVFFDDDAVPKPDCIEEHVKVYGNPIIGGVAGDTVVSTIANGVVEELEEVEVAPSWSARTCLSARLWNRPVKGLEQYRCCVTRCGSIWHGFFMENNPVGNYAYWRKKGMVRSFLGVGANMSVLASAAKGTSFEKTSEWKRGYGWEQFLAWQVWKKGYSMVLNPKAQVQHIFTKGHLTGSLYALGLKNPVSSELRKNAETEKAGYELLKENHLFFFRLYHRGNGLSLLDKSCSAVNYALGSLRNMRSLEEFQNLKVLFVSNLIGLRWLLSSHMHAPRATKIVHAM